MSVDAAAKRKGPRVAPKPDFEKHAAALKDLNDQIDATKSLLNKLRERIQALTHSTADTATSDKRDDLRSQLKAVKKRKEDAERSYEDTLRRVHALQKAVRAKSAELHHLKDRFGFASADEAADRIRALEAMVASGSLKLLDEKKAINEIAQLKRSKPLFDTFATKEAEIARDAAELADLEASLATLKPSHGELASSFEDVRRELDSLAATKKLAEQKAQALYEERKLLQDKLTALYNDRNALQDAFRVAKEEHYRSLREDRERRQVQYAEQKKRLEAERLAALAEEERERAEVPAFSNEILVCTNLIAYLRQQADIKPRSSAKRAAAANPVGGPHQLRQVEAAVPQGATLLKRGTDEDADALFTGMGKAKSAKGSKKKAATAKSSSPQPAASTPTAPTGNGSPAALSSSSTGSVFKFPLTIMENFWLVKVEIPVTTAEAESTIAALEARRAWYQTHQAAVTARNKAAAEAKIAQLMAATKVDESSADDQTMGEASPRDEDVEVTDAQDA
ncbi:multicopy suppressor of BFA (Brefeldin A) [Blastocladiella emersonii ATCC 22665]|nr:multicopy suppressor of BFA (Brefeldin A) [Blastocladiella emersonii ATCC 22665]